MQQNNLILNRFFTKQTLSSLVLEKAQNFSDTIVRRYLHDKTIAYNIDLFSEVYNYMLNNYRNEYIYQNIILNRLLLEKHSVETTTALSQVPIEKSKADFILINGKAVVYEIKTELDSFERLEQQIENYYKAFTHVCLVTSYKNKQKSLELFKNTSVGIYTLTSKNSLQVTQEPKKNEKLLNHISLYKLMRKAEIEQILLSYHKKLPETTQVLYYKECLAAFRCIPIRKLYKLCLIELKKRNKISNKEAFEKLPISLRSLIYFYNFSHVQYNNLLNFLDAPYKKTEENYVLSTN